MQLQTREKVVTKQNICSGNNFIIMCFPPWIMNKQGGKDDFPVTTCNIHIQSQNMVNIDIHSMFIQ